MTTPSVIPGQSPIAVTPVYTLSSVLGSWSGNVTDAYGCDWIVTGEKGWSARPAARSDAIDYDYADGEAAGPVYYTARLITLTGTCIAPDRAAMLAAKDRFAAAGAARTGVLLTVVEAHRTRQCAVRVTDAQQSVDNGSHVFAWEVTVRAADPRRYSNQLRIATIANDSTGTTTGLEFPVEFPLDFGGAVSTNAATLVNDGTWTTALTAVFNGPWTNPGLESDQAGTYVTFAITLQAGEFLVVDFGARDVLLGGTASRLYTIDPGSRWWLLQPGANSIRARGFGGVGAHVDLTYRSAWI